ncbi:CRAL/TRIO domain-containing protein [Terfezia boudieri ATCC MYA-4762]|uniref:Phosphatidylinositol transfer protein SFH5 n=1 Tax=Terfezia boudieri ATCC MYA-4762 TaxID=1051890 RepID=A0A3N4LQ77_9PEZI|nr:CRAL/TRIO domain-containing protein [Terfezia boudieri ATCC MYA-4762]
MSEPISPNPTGIAPSSEHTTAAPPAEAITASPETVKSADSTEVAATTISAHAAPSSEETEPATAETAPTEKAPETAPVEATANPVPATITHAITDEPSEEGLKVESLKVESLKVEPLKVESLKVESPAAITTPVISSGLSWPAIDKRHPLAQFQARLPELLKTAGHDYIWGITLSADEPISFHTTLVLQKFLRANCNNIEAAYSQLLETLKWRKAYNPMAACEEEFSQTKFGGLGYIMKTQTNDGEKIVTYNIYGACKEPKKTFGDLDSFLRWRIALMEMGVKALDLPNATAPIPDYNAANPGSAIDPYQMIQLHDYQNVSFLRMDSATKAASKKAIEVMANYYPELLSIKYFVNIPVVMSWVFTAMKAILSKETVRKFRVISSGKGVASDLRSDELPKAYGGKGADLAEAGLRPKLFKDTPPPPSEKEKKPSKKSSMASLDKVREKVAETIAPVTETKESTTAPAPTVATIPEAKEEEAAAEKMDSPPKVPVKDDAPEASEALKVPAKEEAPATPVKDVNPTPAAEVAPEVPAKDESSAPTNVAVSNTVVEGSTTVDEPTCSVSGATDTEQSVEPVLIAVDEAPTENQENTKYETLPMAPVCADETPDVNATAE